MSDTNNPSQNPPVNPQTVQNLNQHLDDITEAEKKQIHQDPKAGQQLSTDPALQDEVVEIEKELLQEIVTRVNQNKMSQQDAQKLAKEFIAFLPIQDKKDLLKKMKQLSDDNSAASGLYLKYAKEEEETQTQQKLTLMSKHIQEGNIEHALNVAKGVPNG